MKIALIITSSDKNLIASRYKYTRLFQKIFGEQLQIIDESHFNRLRYDKPDFAIVFGSFRHTYQLPLRFRIPYVLCDHDIVSLYRPGEAMSEPQKIRNARKIIFTSPDHRDYVVRRYHYPIEQTLVLYLRPSIDDLDFKPLPKMEGKNLVYVGGLLDGALKVNRTGRFAYRCYEEIFERFIEEGWKVHLYASRKRPQAYHNLGCIYHPRFDEGKPLYQQISQFQLGLQGFELVGESFNYAKTCRPNKIWNYLAGGIPTIGINPGHGIELYEGKWGKELKDIGEINNITWKDLDIERWRREEVIENQLEEVRTFFSDM